MVSSTALENSCTNLSSVKLFAFLMIFSLTNNPFESFSSNSFMATIRLTTSCFSKNIPVSFSFMVSLEPPLPNAITGAPHACASSGAKPKSSSAQKIKALHRCK